MPFTSAENALESITAIADGEITPELANFLEANVPGGKATLGVQDPRIGNVISEALVSFRMLHLFVYLPSPLSLSFPPGPVLSAFPLNDRFLCSSFLIVSFFVSLFFFPFLRNRKSNVRVMKS